MSGRKVLREKVNGLLIPEDEVTALAQFYMTAANATVTVATGTAPTIIKSLSAAAFAEGVTPDYVNGKFAVPEAGVYEVEYSVSESPGSGTSWIAYNVIVNAGATGEALIRQGEQRHTFTSSGEAYATSGSAIVNLSAGDTVSLGVRHGVASSVAVTLFNFSLTIRKIGG